MAHGKKHEGETVTGLVESFTINPHQDLDGMVILHDGTRMLVKFPPHTAAYVRKVAPEGQVVTVVYEDHEHHGPAHGPRGKEPHDHPPKKELVRIESCDAEFEVKVVPPPHTNETNQVFSLKIKKPEFTKGKKGELTGIRSDGRFIHLKPKETEAISRELVTAAELKIRARKRLQRLGFVNVQGDEVYHGLSVELNGEVYPLRK